MTSKDEAIIILAHGSRNVQAAEEFLRLANLVQERLPSYRIEPVFFQFSENNLHQGLKKLTISGYKKVKIVPVFLFEGVHIKEDIPKVISEEKRNFPDLEISLSGTLWPDKRITDIIADRIKEKT